MTEKNHGLHGGKILARRVPATNTVDTSAGVPVGVAAKHTLGDARIHLVKEGDVIKRIEVTCACGKLISLICE